MKSTVEQLTSKERTALINWYDSESYQALKHLAQLEIAGLGDDALNSPSHEQTKFYSGQAVMAAKLIRIVQQLYKEHLKNKEKK